MSYRFAAALIAVAILSGLGGFYLRWWLTQPSATRTPDIIGATATDFQLPDLNGTLQPLSQWRGKPIMLNFWASWCKPCEEELPILQELHQRHQAQGARLVGIALDEPEAAQAMAEELGVEYPILVADFAEGMLLMEAYANIGGAMPYTVTIDRQGKVAARHWGKLSARQAENMIVPLL